MTLADALDAIRKDLLAGYDEAERTGKPFSIGGLPGGAMVYHPTDCKCSEPKRCTFYDRPKM